jgi:hypothetical protein
MYLDEAGVEALYAQTVDRIETERSTTIAKAVGGKVGATARLKNLLLKVLGWGGRRHRRGIERFAHQH